MLQLLSKLIRASGDERRATYDDGRSRSAVCKLNESIDNHKIGWIDRTGRPRYYQLIRLEMDTHQRMN